MIRRRARPRAPLRLPATLLYLAAVTTLPGQASAGPRDSVAVVRPVPRKIAELPVPIDLAVSPAPDGRFFLALQARPDPVLWVVPADGGAAFSYRKSWPGYRPRWSPSGHRIGFITAGDPPRIWTVEVDPASGRAIDPPRMLIRTDANAFAFAPDGGRIALVVARSTARGASEIRIVDWESRRERVLLRERGVIDRLDWSADGKLIFYGLLSHTPGGDAVTSVRCVPAAGGAAETVLERVVYLGLAPDGSYLLYRRLDDDAATTVVQAMPLTDGPSLRIELPAGFDAPVWSSSATGLLQVRYSAGGAEIWEIPLRPRG